jgi:hypothetical protein
MGSDVLILARLHERSVKVVEMRTGSIEKRILFSRGYLTTRSREAPRSESPLPI